jgi:hypothetical protein
MINQEKDQYGRNNQELFIEEYLGKVGLSNLPPQFKRSLAEKLKQEEERLVFPILQEIHNNNLKDEDYDIFLEKIKTKTRRYAEEDANSEPYKTNTAEDRAIMEKHEAEVRPVGEVSVPITVFEPSSLEEAKKGFIK